MTASTSLARDTAQCATSRRGSWLPGLAFAVVGAAVARVVAAATRSVGASLGVGGEAIPQPGPQPGFTRPAFVFSVVGVVLAAVFRRWPARPAPLFTWSPRACGDVAPAWPADSRGLRGHAAGTGSHPTRRRRSRHSGAPHPLAVTGRRAPPGGRLGAAMGAARRTLPAGAGPGSHPTIFLVWMQFSFERRVETCWTSL